MLWRDSAFEVHQAVGVTSLWVCPAPFDCRCPARATPPYVRLHPAVLLQAFLAYMGSSWFDTLAVCTAAHNFSAGKGLALGLTKSLYGLSASLLTTAYENLFEPDITRFLAFLAIFIPVVGACFLLLVSRVSGPSLLSSLTRFEVAKFAGGYVGVLAVAVYVGEGPPACLCSGGIPPLPLPPRPAAAAGILNSTGAIGMTPALAYTLIPLVLLQLLLAVPAPLPGTHTQHQRGARWGVT